MIGRILDSILPSSIASIAAAFVDAADFVFAAEFDDDIDSAWEAVVFGPGYLASWVAVGQVCLFLYPSACWSFDVHFLVLSLLAWWRHQVTVSPQLELFPVQRQIQV